MTPSHLHISYSRIHGVGLFSRCPLSSDEPLFLVTGELKQADYDEQYSHGAVWLSLRPNQWIEPEQSNPARFLNHSCSPNVVWRDGGWIVTTTPIPVGTEIVLDYATTELDPFWRLDCKCGAPQCRGIVVPAFSEKPETRQALEALTPGFIRKYWPPGSSPTIS
jgi:hypothetical protein